jgi:phage protein D
MLSNQYSNYSPTLTTNQQVRQPRAIVTINGIAVLWIDITITTTTFYVADSYRVVIPLKQQPYGFNIGYLATQSMLTINIYIGFPQDPNAFNTSDLDLLMVGDCDEMNIDPLNATITFSGRDLTSRMIDTKIVDKYPNMTASQIVSQIATSHKLNVDNVQATSSQVGIFYTRQNTLMTKETTQWDLITFLAQQSGFVAFVMGNNMFFEPTPNLNTTIPFLIQYQIPTLLSGSPITNVMRLNMMRSFTVTKDVTVKVRVPYSPQSGRSFTVSAGKTNPTINSSSAGNQIYTFSYSGLSRQQALNQAQMLLKQISANELKISATMPGNNLLLKSSIIQLTGTGSRFDQIYYTDTVTRTLNVEDGYLMEIEAKNIDVNSQVTL